MKKVLALVLAMLMVLSVGSAFAATIIVESGTTAGDGSDSQDVLNGETYNAYKILNYRQSGTAFNYYLTAAEYGNGLGALLESVGFHFTQTFDGEEYYVDNTASLTDASAIANGLYAIRTDVASAAIASATATASADKAAVFDNLDIGYWFVTSSLGALTSLQSYDAQSVIVEKNAPPTVDKTQSADADGTFAATTLDFDIGDIVYYKVDVTDGTGTNQDIVLTDTLSDGLTLNHTGTWYTVKKGTETVAADNYTMASVTDHGFVLTLLASYVSTLDAGDVITIEYNATINENAVVDDPDDNSNTIELDYSEQHDSKTIYVETYDFIVYKTDGTDFLDGAEFKLYDAATGGNQILIADEGSGEYVKDATADADVTIDINSDTGCHVRGLAPGTYYLEEVVVPDGYNKLNNRVSVSITSGATAAVEITVVNTAGTELPSTGGIGTTIFYVAGLIMVLGAATILIARRKADAE